MNKFDISDILYNWCFRLVRNIKSKLHINKMTIFDHTYIKVKLEGKRIGIQSVDKNESEMV
ncbi:hypothetical protein [Flavobacterium adhaerens]|uniref:hypothetical protein n=1 Tax=Flavobacterium adhaerens TaxID=3149043 RepID=UPI0032B3BE7C